MSTISKVKSVQGSGTYENDYGTFYKFEYEMEDGTSLSANHKGQTPFPVGAEVEYEIRGTNEYGSYGAVKKGPNAPAPRSSRGGKSYEADPKKQVVIVAQSSMTKAIDLLMSGVVSVEFEDMNDFVQKAEDLADLLMKKQFDLTQKHLLTFKSIEK